MDMEVLAVAEDLAAEFVDLPGSWVVRAVVRCVDEFPSGGPHFIAQAARARLLAWPVGADR